MDIRNSKDRDVFWEAYRACTEENRVRPDRSPFYVRWGKDFDSFLPDKSLKDRSRKDIEAFLADLRKRQGIADWQVRQAEHALRILYEVFLPHYTPERHPTVAPAGKHPTQEGMAKADGFRDRVIPGEVERQFPELIERVKTEIRARHYSYRTETSYLDGVRRFIAFHDYAAPRGLDAPTAVKIYLDYLAVEREVAANTQNQALNALVFFYGQVLQKPASNLVPSFNPVVASPSMGRVALQAFVGVALGVE
jgi:Phage integrase, N-terminal SAM-like domain